MAIIQVTSKKTEMTHLSHKTKKEEDGLDQEGNVEAFHGHREVYQSNAL